VDILFLTPYLPSPPRSGGPRRLNGLIGGLAPRHSVSVLSLLEPGDHAEAIAETQTYCDEVVVVPNERYGQRGVPNPQKRRHQARSMLSPHSYEHVVYRRPALQAALDRLVRRRRYDVINVEFSLMAHYRLPRSSTLVLDEHNIEYDIMYRTYKAESQMVRRAYSYLNFLKLRREERAAWRRFDGCVLTSVRDQRVLQDSFPALPTAVVPNAVDTRAFRPGSAPADPRTILFFGAMDYYPNTDGILFFLREVLPRLKPRYPELKVLIVGQAPPEAVRQWADEQVTVTGFVDDVQPYIRRAGLVIAPLRIGGGTRLKIVEAMAMGKAIVATTIGAEGIDVTHGENILLANSGEAFAAQVGHLLDDPLLATRLGTGARLLAETRYDWQASVGELERFYERLVGAGPDARASRPPAATAAPPGHSATP
jgi:glycosyltransferase involved in cell wall biosynthesis